MSLLSTFESLLESWRELFPQARTHERARRLTFGMLSCPRRHLTSNAICAAGLDGRQLETEACCLTRICYPIVDVAG